MGSRLLQPGTNLAPHPRLPPNGSSEPLLVEVSLIWGKFPGRIYRFTEPELNVVHLHHREGPQRGFLPDLYLDAGADVSGPNHQEAQRLAPCWGDKGAPEVDVLAHELRNDSGSRPERRNSSWNSSRS